MCIKIYTIKPTGINKNIFDNTSISLAPKLFTLSIDRLHITFSYFVTVFLNGNIIKSTISITNHIISNISIFPSPLSYKNYYFLSIYIHFRNYFKFSISITKNDNISPFLSLFPRPTSFLIS